MIAVLGVKRLQAESTGPFAVAGDGCAENQRVPTDLRQDRWSDCRSASTIVWLLRTPTVAVVE